MTRFFIELSYRGTNYHGWQRQDNAISVQEVFEKAMAVILGDEIGITGAGRTDTGVHALYYAAHFDLNKPTGYDLEKLVYKLNSYLPDDISVLNIFPVQPEAHARFDALSRTYQYRIARRKDPFATGFSMLYTGHLNIEKMNIAANALKEYHDFDSFCKLHSDNKTTRCIIYEASWRKEGNMLYFEITADRFLRNMVRAIVGTLIDVGRGKIDYEGFKDIIKAKDRKRAGASVVAEGLFLTKIYYPKTIYVNLT